MHLISRGILINFSENKKKLIQKINLIFEF